MNDEANKIIREVTEILIENGCTVNKLAMLELAIYIVEREKLSIAKHSPSPPVVRKSAGSGEIR